MKRALGGGGSGRGGKWWRGEVVEGGSGRGVFSSNLNTQLRGGGIRSFHPSPRPHFILSKTLLNDLSMG